MERSGAAIPGSVSAGCLAWISECLRSGGEAEVPGGARDALTGNGAAAEAATGRMGAGPLAPAGLRKLLDDREGPGGAAFRERLSEIICEVARLHGRRAEDVRVSMDIEHNHPSAGTAFLCGLVVAELVSACLDRPEAEEAGLGISVTLRHTGAGKIILSVRTACGRVTGRAGPSRIRLCGPGPLGLLAGRLRGELAGDESGGAAFRAVFREEDLGSS